MSRAYMSMCMEEAADPFIAAIYASALAWGLTIVLFAVFRLYGMLAGAVLGIVLATEAARGICGCRLLYATSVAAFVNMLYSAAFFSLIFGGLSMWRIVLMMGLSGIAAFLAASFLYCRRQAGRLRRN